LVFAVCRNGMSTSTKTTRMPPNSKYPRKARQQAKKGTMRGEKKPQRQTKKQKEKVQQSSNGFESIKQARADPRMGTNPAPHLTMSQGQKTIAQQCVMGPNSMVGFALGYVTRALEKGYGTFASNPAFPSYAFAFLQTVLIQAANGGAPPVQKLPFCVLAFCQAISQKTVGIDQGHITYSFDVQTVNPNLTAIVNFTGNKGAWICGDVPEISLGLVDGFPIINTAYSLPSEGAGEQAFEEMNEFLLEHASVPGKPSIFRLVDITTPTCLRNDVSAFSVYGATNGTGFAGPASGGWNNQANLEVPIYRPFLATFGNGLLSDAVNANRWGNLVQNVSGDAITIGYGIGLGERRWGIKRNTKLAFIDFGEIVDVVATWVQSLQTAASNDPTGQWAGSPSNYQCPLSFQEMCLLLRNTMMGAFKNSQAGVQGLSNVVPVGPAWFTAYTAGSGTCFLQAIEWKLPRMVVENIRALVERVAKRHSKDLEMFTPVLGQLSVNAFSSAFYNYSWPLSGSNPSGTAPSFFVPTFRRKVQGSKGEELWSTVPETVISLIDGSCTPISTLTYLAINNPQQLRNLATEWDNWLTQFNLSSYSSSLVTFGTDTGVNILFSGMMNRLISLADIDYRGARTGPSSSAALVVKEVEKVGKRYGDKDPAHWIAGRFRVYSNANYDPNEIAIRKSGRRVGAPLNAFYTAVPAIADLSQSDFLQAPYEAIQSYWVLPQVPLISMDVQGYVTQKVQALMKQPFLQNASSGFDGQSLGSLHAVYATKMVKSKQENESDADRFFNQMDEQGEGGILSSLVGTALGALFPQAKGIINTVADIVPF